MKQRLRVSPKGSIKLPEDLRETLGWTTGSYLEYERTERGLELWCVEVDHFAEAMKKPDQEGFDKILRKQKESQSKASDSFDEKIKDAPREMRPEDRPEFWD